MTAAFDVGTRNFAFAVKHDGQYVLLKNISLIADDYMTKSDLNKLKKKDLVDMVADDLYISERPKSTKKDYVDLLHERQKKTRAKTLRTDLGAVMFDVLDTYDIYWNTCDTFLIERQMATNMRALKLSHYLEAYLKIRYKSKDVLNYNSSFKTKKLGADNRMDKKQRKEWTVAYVKNILTDDKLDYFNSLTKKDDVADVVCMIESHTR
jgi:hypothetical protein